MLAVKPKVVTRPGSTQRMPGRVKGQEELQINETTHQQPKAERYRIYQSLQLAYELPWYQCFLRSGPHLEFSEAAF